MKAKKLSIDKFPISGNPITKSNPESREANSLFLLVDNMKT